MTFLTTQFGKPFTAAGFGNWFLEQRNDAGLPHCSAHGLRKAAARRLAEAGCTEHEIAAITGHASLREVARYTKGCGSTAACPCGHGEGDRKTRTEPVKPCGRFDKSGEKAKKINLRVSYWLPGPDSRTSSNHLKTIYFSDFSCCGSQHKCQQFSIVGSFQNLVDRSQFRRDDAHVSV